MVRKLLSSVLFLAAITSTVLAADSAPTCGGGSQCPEDSPCCSQYGACGVGAYCLGGCDPANSFSLDSCVPAPVCQSKSFDFSNLDGIVPNTKYLGDASKADWVSSGEPVSFNNQVWLTLTQDGQAGSGTLLRSTRYMWYGKATARLSTSAGAGVVTAFILLGDSKDEIDFEFVGVSLGSAQTNFYSQGVTNYDNGGNSSVKSDVHANMHTYEIDWTPDTITWSIDGTSVRTLDRESTWNATANRYSYPQTPAQIQLSLWPAGLSSNGEGTINWGGGLVDWSSPYMVNGYYYAAFDSVSIDCYDPPDGANIQGSKSYVYTDASMTNSTVEITDKKTVLKSLLGTGTDMNAGDPNASSSAGGSSKTSDVATIPGLTGAGPGSDGQRGGSSDGTTSSSNGNSGTSGSDTQSGSGSQGTGFVQGDSGSSGAGPVGGHPERVLQGSLFAVVIAIIGLCVL